MKWKILKKLNGKRGRFVVIGQTLPIAILFANVVINVVSILIMVILAAT